MTTIPDALHDLSLHLATFGRDHADIWPAWLNDSLIREDT